ncbi:MAG: TonB family protein [Opitutaceae bacterium]
MTRDFITGFVLSLAVHGGVFLASDLFAKPPAPPKGPDTDDTKVIIVMPPPPLDEIELVPDTDPADKAKDADPVSPPQQPEVITLVTVDTMTQKPQPPPSPDVRIDHHQLAIPASVGPGGGGGNKEFKIIDRGLLDDQPTARYQAQPVYPFEMRRSGITGEVVVGFIVDSNGGVRDVYAIRSTQREFEPAALQAVAKWKFRPGRKDGRAVNTRMQVPIVFNITGE